MAALKGFAYCDPALKKKVLNWLPKERLKFAEGIFNRLPDIPLADAHNYLRAIAKEALAKYQEDPKIFTNDKQATYSDAVQNIVTRAFKEGLDDGQMDTLDVEIYKQYKQGFSFPYPPSSHF